MVVAAFGEAVVWNFHAVLCATAIEASRTSSRLDERFQAKWFRWAARLEPNLIAIANFQWTNQKAEW
jgi:hypothetical protein